jgi:hypothetical protein
MSINDQIIFITSLPVGVVMYVTQILVLGFVLGKLFGWLVEGPLTGLIRRLVRPKPNLFIEWLLKFCCADEPIPGREWMSFPFSIGEHTYATDGRIIARVAKCREATACPGLDPSKVLRLFEGIEFRKFGPMPLYAIVPCSNNITVARFGHHDFQLPFIETIQHLPGLKVCLDKEMMLYAFDGGYGLIMPMHRSHFDPDDEMEDTDLFKEAA